jgi:hypothetical protein
MIHALSRPFVSREGAPVLTHVDDEIFKLRYFADCMQCSYCFDSCCSYGVDVDLGNVGRIMAHRTELEAWTGTDSSAWFTGDTVQDPEFPGGAHTRTSVQGGKCVFLNRRGRGCMIHSYCIAKGIPYQTLKPMVSSLFPLTFDHGLLHASEEAADKSLQCADDGPALLEGVRHDLEYYFGTELLTELDGLRAKLKA